MNNPVDAPNTSPKLISYKGENYSYEVLGIQPLHFIGGMSDAEFFYFVSVLNEPSGKLKTLHQEAVSSGRQKPAETLGILIAIKEADDELLVRVMHSIHNLVSKILSNHVKNHHAYWLINPGT